MLKKSHKENISNNLNSNQTTTKTLMQVAVNCNKFANRSTSANKKKLKIDPPTSIHLLYVRRCPVSVQARSILPGQSKEAFASLTLFTSFSLSRDLNSHFANRPWLHLALVHVSFVGKTRDLSCFELVLVLLSLSAHYASANSPASLFGRFKLRQILSLIMGGALKWGKVKHI